MKRTIAAMLALALAFSFAACGKAPEKEGGEDYVMYIETAQLTEEEEKIADLLGANVGQIIYDFVLDETVESIQINTYELDGREWKLVTGGGGQAFSGAEGRLALEFEDLAKGLRIALQGGGSNGSTTYTTGVEDDGVAIGRATSMLTERTEIVYEQEIPLVIQISTAQNTIHSYNVEYFFEPEMYEKHGYEHVRAITVMFSRKTVSELSMTN